MLSLLAKARTLKNASKLILPTATNLFHTSQICQKKKKKGCGPDKVAVILSGCGALDGTEISEAISIAIHVSSKAMVPEFYAPDLNICGPVNHLTKDPEDCVKNALIESARLARGQVKPLCECSPCCCEAVVIPGGFGAARTLSDFAAKGCDCIVLPDIERILNEFSCANKPIGAVCIAAALVAKVMKGAKVTLGRDCPQDRWCYADAIEKVKQMGATIEMHDVKGVTHCKEHNVFTTPAWMDSQATYAEVHEGIGKMVAGLKKHMR